MTSIATHPYDYKNAASIATRAIVTDTKPTELPCSSSHDHSEHNTQSQTSSPTKTDHYEQAASAAAQRDMPGVQRMQSWKMDDMKREAHERLLGSTNPQGYHSSGQ